jgi:hypothetical protein
MAHYTRQNRHGDALYETPLRRHRDARGQFEGGGWRPFEQARAYVRTLRHAGPAHYKAWAKSGERPADIPARPDWVYKDQGWSGWRDWLREVAVTRPGSRLRRTAVLVPTGVAPAPDRPVHIYGLTEPDQPSAIRYVGQVWQPPGRSAEEALQKRLKEHISLAKAKHGSANHRINWIKRVLSASSKRGGAHPAQEQYQVTSECTSRSTSVEAAAGACGARPRTSSVTFDHVGD